MSYRLKNSDFKPFLGIFDRKVNDLWVHVGEGIGIYFGVISSGESVPGVGVGGEVDGKRVEFVVWVRDIEVE